MSGIYLTAKMFRKNLDRQGRVHEIRGDGELVAAIAKEYAKEPTNTLVVSPDNRSRTEINERIHAELQRRGIVGGKEPSIRALVPRQDLTGADRTWAARYDIGDVLLASIEGDRHCEEHLRAGEEYRRSHQPANS